MRIRPGQIRVTSNAVIVGDTSNGGSEVSTANANQALVFDGTSTTFSWIGSLYDSTNGAESARAVAPGTTRDGNYIELVRNDAGNAPVIRLAGTDATNSDILIQPNSGGVVLLPTGYEANIATDTAVPNVRYVKQRVYTNDWKPSVRAATASASDLTGMNYDAGTDTWSTGTSVTFDGVSLVNGDRVLIKDATTQAGNGIWVWDSTAQTMTRPEDADENSEVSGGMAVYVAEGTANAQSVFVLISPTGQANLGTDNLTFTKLVDTGAGNLTAGPGIDITGSTISIKWINDGNPGGLTQTTTTADSHLLAIHDGTAHYAITRGNFLGAAQITMLSGNGIELQAASPTGNQPLLASPADGQFAIGFGAADTRLRIDRTTGTDASVRLIATDGLLLPSGTTAQRPSAPTAGTTRYNSDNNQVEYYNGTAWVPLYEPRWGYDETQITAPANSGADFTITNFFTNVPLGAPTNENHIHVFINGVGLRNAEFSVGGATNQDLIIHQATLGYDLAANDWVWARYVY